MTRERSPTPSGRMTLRVITRDEKAAVQEIFEQSIPASYDEVALFLRRTPARASIGEAMLAGHTITIERIK